MPSIIGNIKVEYDFEDLEDLIGAEGPEETKIEHGNAKAEFVLSKHFVLTADQLATDARAHLGDSHPSLKLERDFEVDIEDDRIVVMFIIS